MALPLPPTIVTVPFEVVRITSLFETLESVTEPLRLIVFVPVK